MPNGGDKGRSQDGQNEQMVLLRIQEWVVTVAVVVFETETDWLVKLFFSLLGSYCQ